MSLVRLRDFASLTQVAIALLAAALGGAVAPAALAIAVLLSAWAYVRPLPPTPSPAVLRAWTLAVVAAGVGTTARAFLLGDFLDAGVDYLLLLIVQRLFNRQHAREHLQIALLGALLMIVAAVVNVGLNYPVLLAAYTAAVVVALMLNHLVSEGERLGARVSSLVAQEAGKSRRLLVRAALQVSVIAMVGAAIVFLVFPRWGVGVFLRGAMARETTSGFSSEVKLGGFGRIKTDSTVIMRIQPRSSVSAGDRASWHLRGTSFDVYQAGEWRRSGRGEVVDIRQVRGWSSLTIDGEPLLAVASVGVGRDRPPRLIAPAIAGFAASEEVLHAVVTLEDLGVDALFVASEPLAVRLAPRGPLEARAELRTGRHRELRVDKPPGPIRYEFAARTGTPTYAELEAVGDPPVPRELALYAEPGIGLSTEVGELARELTSGTSTRAQRVAAIMDHLGGFEYTLDQPQSERVEHGADPIEGFLFDTQAGHCEYFATAMALLLRELDVPTRIVNGYHGAHWNRMGEYYAVRQADAHSWVEVDFGPLGWVTFDPTPPAGRAAGDAAPLWPAASQLLDALRNAYLDWIIDYNLGKQLALLEGLGMRRSGVERTRVQWRPLLIAFASVVFVFVVATRLRRRRRGAVRPDTVLWQRVTRKLATVGHSPTQSESPTAFATRLEREGVPGSAALAEFCALYEHVRFGAGEGGHALERLRAAARTAIAAIGRRSLGHTRGR